MRHLMTALVLLTAMNLAAAKDDTWVIGLDADMSSVASQGGEAIQRGIELAINEINAQGGVLGKPLELEVRDHRGNPARGIANLKAFKKRENLLAVVGGVHTPVAIAQLPVIHELPLVYLSPWAAGTPVVKNGFQPNFVFRLSVRDEWAGKVILQEAKDDQCRSISLMLERTGWGRSNENSMTAASAELDLPIDSINWFNWKSTVLPDIVNNLASSNVECIAVVANTPEGVSIVRAVSDLPSEKRPRLYSHWGITGGDFIEQVGLETLSTVSLKFLQTIAFDAPKTAQGESLVQAYIDQYGDTKGHNAFNGVAHAYDLTWLLALAVKNAGDNDPANIQSSLEKIAYYEGAMKTYEYPFSAENHEALNANDYLLLRFNEFGFSQK